MAVVALADRQHGCITTRQLLEIGLSRSTIVNYVARGRLFALYRGVYAVGRRRLTRRGEYAAAILAVPHGVLSHQSAADLQEIRRDRSRLIHVTSPRKQRPYKAARRAGGGPAAPLVRVHFTRSLDPEDVTVVDGIAVTAPMRTVTDLGDALSRDGHEQAVATAMRLGLIEQPVNTRGRRAIAPRPRYTRSQMERRLLRAIRAAGLPEPETNVRVAGWERDFVWPAFHLIVELDPYVTHHDRRTFDSDRRKKEAAEDEGWRVVSVTDRQLERELPDVVGRLGRRLARR